MPSNLPDFSSLRLQRITFFFLALLACLSAMGQVPMDTTVLQEQASAGDAVFYQVSTDHLPVQFFWRLLINLVTVFLLVRLVHFRNYRDAEHLFLYFLFNLVIFLITYLLNKVNMSLGAAFGLFAVFSIIRYRTEDISVRDMTYLFVVIAVGLVSAVSTGTMLELIILDGMIFLMVFLLDSNVLLRHEQSQLIEYDQVEKIKPDQKMELLSDLSSRTGLPIHRVQVRKIDFLRDTATLRIYYYDKTLK